MEFKLGVWGFGVLGYLLHLITARLSSLSCCDLLVEASSPSSPTYPNASDKSSCVSGCQLELSDSFVRLQPSEFS